MALQSFTITIGALTDAGNNGKNYVNNQPVYIKRTNGTLANIYRDLAGTSQITQDGLANVTNSKGQFTFFVEAGDYNAEYQSQVTPITVVGADYFNNRIDETVNQIILDLSSSRGFRVKGSFAAGFTYELPNDVGVDGSGLYWIYTDASALPFTVPAATTPSAPTYTQVTFNDAQAIVYGENGNVDAALRKRSGNYTLAEAQAVNLDVGQRITLIDYANATYEVVADADTGGFYLSYKTGFKFKYLAQDYINPAELDNSDGLATQRALGSTNSVVLPSKTLTISSGIVSAIPKKITGDGALTVIETTPSFTGNMLSIAPTAGTDPKGWRISDFTLRNNGSATNAILIDINNVNEYVSKLILENIISENQVSNYFVELLNSLPNADGLFTVVIRDNWSLGGYYLNNVGDSVLLQANTTTGDGTAYYINQLATAANITIRDGNCTSKGNALHIVKGHNTVFDNMQVECPAAFTGVNNALITLDGVIDDLVFNTKITNCNLNTQNNPLYCIHLRRTSMTHISGNEFYCNPNTGAHIVVDTDARDTLIGPNKYYSCLDGTEIEPIIVDNGSGTAGIWKAVSSVNGWTVPDPVNEHLPSCFKSLDGMVFMRGRLTGSAASVGDTVLVLPQGFRPKGKTILLTAYGSSAHPAVVVQILPTGELQILTDGATGIYLSDLSFGAN
jgi:hypothetical protein